MSITQALIRSKGISVFPATISGGFTNSPPSNIPSNRTVSTISVTASDGTGSYSWARISGSTAISADSPSSATTTFSGSVPVNTIIAAVFQVTSGAETANVAVSLSYDSGF